jgi:hypothetical protein
MNVSTCQESTDFLFFLFLFQEILASKGDKSFFSSKKLWQLKEDMVLIGPPAPMGRGINLEFLNKI